MDRFKRLQEERKELERRQKELESQIVIIKKEQENKSYEISNCYQEFFDRKQNKKFALYERFPSREMLQAYKKQRFPLHGNGEFKTKELAEMIKQLYSFERQKKYEILTLGLVAKDTDKDHGWEFERLLPHLYFLVGNEKTLESFKEYDGQFINEEFLKSSLEDICKKNFLAMEVERYPKNPENCLPMECLTGSLTDKKGKINYHNYLKYKTNEVYTAERCDFSNYSQIFKNPLTNSMSFNENYRKGCFKKDYYHGIQSVLKYNLVTPDAFIAKVLVSICIYKRNNGITELTSDDYNHIFESLYGERVDIIGLAEKDITRNLTYVPNSRYGI